MNNFSSIVKQFELVLLLGLIVTAAVAQSNAPLEEVTLLNRSGKWQRAAQLAENFLSGNQSKNGEEQCQAFLA